MDVKRYKAIKIKPSHKGIFTEKAKAAGQSVQGFASMVMGNKEDYSSKVSDPVKMAEILKVMNYSLLKISE